MPTDISNAIGTARQFTPQPDAQYQGRYQGVGAITASTADTSRATTLAANMERLNVALQGYAVSHEKYLESTGLDQAELMINKMSDADIKRLNVIDAAQQEGFVDASSNPYFRAYAEKLRGNYLATQMKQEYDNEYAMNPAASADEEQARYRDFADSWKETNLQGTSRPINMYNFDRGFEESNLVNLAQLGNAWNKKKNEDDIVVTMASVQSKLGDIIENSPELLKTNGAMTEAVQTVFNEVRLMGLPANYRQKLLDDFATQLVQTGHLDSTRLEQMMDNVVVQADITGQTMKAADLVNMQTYKTYAAAYNRQFTTKWKEDIKQKFIDKKDFNGALAYLEDTRKNDPDKAPEVEQMVREIKTGIEQKKREDEARVNARLRGGLARNSDMMKLSNTANVLKTWLNGGTMYNGQTISAIQIDKDTLYQQATQLMQDAMQNNDFNRLNRLMSMPQMGALRNDIAADLTYKLDSIRLGSDGSPPQLDASTQALINFVSMNPNSVEHLFNADIGKRGRILKSLLDLHGGDQQAMLTDFATYNSADKETKDLYKGQVNDLIASTWYTAEGVPYLDGSGTRSLPIYGNAELQDAVADLSTIYCLQGLSPWDALNKAGSTIQKNFISHHDGVFPKGITMDIDYGMTDSQSMEYFKRALDDAMSWNPDATLRFDRASQQFAITYPDGSTEFKSVDYIRRAARERWESDLEWYQTHQDYGTSTTTADTEMSIDEINTQRDGYDFGVIQSTWQVLGTGG